MSGWRAIGYPVPGLFKGAWACRFRLAHVRDGGLAVMTVGDQRDNRGHLSPVSQGFNFITFVAQLGDETAELDRVLCNDAETAAANHDGMLAAYGGEVP